MRTIAHPRRTAALLVCLAAGFDGALTRVAAQFDDTAIPEAMTRLDFVIGEWTVEGRFRTPDHISQNRKLWYTTRGGGITSFDGTAWVAFRPGDSVEADSVMRSVTARAEPFPFTNALSAHRIQDGFALMLDEGKTSGTTVIYYDTGQDAWVATSFHAPTNAVTTAIAPAADGLPVFEGRGRDRRGERIFRRRFEVRDSAAFTIRTDVSFDEGATWIEDQIVQEVRRRDD